MSIGNYGKALEYTNVPSFDRLSAGLVVGSNLMNVWLQYDLPNKFLKNKCLFEIGKINEAKSGYDELLTIKQIRDSGEIYWNILFDRGRIALIEGHKDKAIEFFKKAIEVIEQQRSTINTDAAVL